MNVLDLTYYGNTIRAWLVAILLAAVAFTAFQVVKAALLRRHTRFGGAVAEGADEAIRAMAADASWAACAAASGTLPARSAAVAHTATRAVASSGAASQIVTEQRAMKGHLSAEPGIRGGRGPDTAAGPVVGAPETSRTGPR